MNNNYLARVIVAVIFIPTILRVSYQGGWWLYGMILLFTIMAISEFLTNEGLRPRHLLFWVTFLSVLLLFAHGTADFLIKHLSFSQSKFLASFSIVPLTAVFFLISGIMMTGSKELPEASFTKQCRVLWGVVYVGLLYPIVFLLGSGFNSYHGGDLLLFLFGIIWISDTTAMEMGKRWGKRKFSPLISPNKTVEGFLSGLIAAAALGIVMHFWKFENISILHLLLISLGCSLFGQLGDLVESMWKRSLNIKDSSSVIPGHGGILDRFDSLLFAAPFMYAYLRLMSP